MLSNLGKDVKMDLSESISSQVKAALDAMRKEVEGCNSEISSGTQKTSKTVRDLGSNIVKTTKEVETQSARTRDVIQKVTQGYNELGQAITEVSRNGSVVRRSTTTKDIAAEVKKANDLYKEQASLLKQLHEVNKKKLEDDMNGGSHYDELIQKMNQLRDAIAQNDEQASSFSRTIQSMSKLSDLDILKSDYRDKLDAFSKSLGEKDLSKTLQAYRKEYQELTKAVSEYEKAIASGDSDRIDFWSQKAQSAQTGITDISAAIKTLTTDKTILDEVSTKAQLAKQKMEEFSNMDSVKSGVASTESEAQKLASSIEVVTKSVDTLSGKSGEIKTVTTGFDKLGQVVREVTSNGMIVSQSTSTPDTLKAANTLYTEQIG